MKLLDYSKKTFTLFLFCLGITTFLKAQNWNQIIKSVASDKGAGDNFGYSVAINGDYAIVGAYLEDENATGSATLPDAGAAYIFKRTGTNWVQEAKIVPYDRMPYYGFGTSVSISGDYAIVGASGGTPSWGALISPAGSAYIFKREGGTWTQEAKIVANDRTAGDYFGVSVSISGDYVIVGAIWEDENATGGATLENAGSAYIFKREGGTWTQEAKIVANDRGWGDNFGVSVSISGDYAIVGAYLEEENATSGTALENAGSAYIFKREGGTWTQEAKIVANDKTAGDNFGISVSISGAYAIVGAHGEGNFTGSAYIFKRTGTVWMQEAKIVANDRHVFDNFGISVSISGDYAIVGAYAEDENATGGASIAETGSAYIFKQTGTTWTQEAKIVANDRAGFDGFGYSVAISGGYAIIGVPFKDENAVGARLENVGAVYFYQGTGIVSITQMDSQNTLKAYPNPVSTILTLETSTVGNYQIVNLLGQTVLSGKTTAQTQHIEVSALPKGAYILKIGAENIKFLKQ